MLVGEQTRQGEGDGHHADPWGGDRDRDRDQAGPEESRETTLGHRMDGQTSVLGGMRHGDLTRGQQQMRGGGRGQQHLGTGDRGVLAGRYDSGQDHRGAGQHRLNGQVGGQQRALPQVTGPRLGEQVSRITRGGQAQRNREARGDLPERHAADHRAEQVQRRRKPVRADDERSLDQPASPVVPREDQVEAHRVTQVPDQQQPGEAEKGQRESGRCPPRRCALPGQAVRQDEEQRNQQGAGGQALGPGVQADPPAPRRVMAHVIGQQRLRAGIGAARMTARDMARVVLAALGGPREQPAVRAACGQRIQRGLMRSLVEHARARPLLRPPDRDRLPIDDLGHLGVRVVEVADQDRLRRADGHAGWLQANLDAVRAQVALLRRVVLGVDEDRVIRARGDARLAADADLLVEVDDPVLAAVHGLRGTGVDAGSVCALVAASHLESPPDLRERPDVHGFDVGPGDSERDFVLALARRSTGVAADAAILVQHLHPALQLLI